MTQHNGRPHHSTEALGLRPPRSSRQRYLKFVEEYRKRRLEDKEESGESKPKAEEGEEDKPEVSVVELFGLRRGKRRQYLREYIGWLWPYRYSVALLFAFALAGA